MRKLHADIAALALISHQLKDDEIDEEIYSIAIEHQTSTDRVERAFDYIKMLQLHHVSTSSTTTKE